MKKAKPFTKFAGHLIFADGVSINVGAGASFEVVSAEELGTVGLFTIHALDKSTRFFPWSAISAVQYSGDVEVRRAKK